MSTIRELQKQVHRNAVSKGWWECQLCNGVGEIPGFGHRGTLGDCPQCNATGKHRNLGESMALIHAEVSEALEAARAPDDILHCDKCNGLGADLVTCGKCKGHGIAMGGNRMAEELADVVIRIMDLCEAEGFDLQDTIKSKMAYNATRPHRHGKAF